MIDDTSLSVVLGSKFRLASIKFKLVLDFYEFVSLVITCQLIFTQMEHVMKLLCDSGPFKEDNVS